MQGSYREGRQETPYEMLLGLRESGPSAGKMSVKGTEGKKSLLYTQRKLSEMVVFHSPTKGALATRGAPNV
jgi:hypothetical protein